MARWEASPEWHRQRAARAAERRAAITDLLAEFDDTLFAEREELEAAERKAARHLAKLQRQVADAPTPKRRLKAAVLLATLQAQSLDRRARIAELDADFHAMAVRYRRRGLPAASIAALTGLPPHLYQFRPKPSDGGAD